LSVFRHLDAFLRAPHICHQVLHLRWRVVYTICHLLMIAYDSSWQNAKYELNDKKHIMQVTSYLWAFVMKRLSEVMSFDSEIKWVVFFWSNFAIVHFMFPWKKLERLSYKYSKTHSDILTLWLIDCFTLNYQDLFRDFTAPLAFITFLYTQNLTNQLKVVKIYEHEVQALHWKNSFSLK